MVTCFDTLLVGLYQQLCNVTVNGIKKIVLFWGEVFLACQLMDPLVEVLGTTFFDDNVAKFLDHLGVVTVDAALLG